MIRPDPNTRIPERIEKPYFAGIGGTGMSAIAKVFLNQGYRVYGSDPKSSPAVEMLRKMGANITNSQAEDIPADTDAFIFTGALNEDNQQYLQAKSLGIPLLHRSQALVYLSRGKKVIAVAGTHGKTTTTGMIATALTKLGANPSFVNGSPIAALGTPAHIGESDYFVIEADESDGSFLFYDTEIAVITNIDPDHLDFWGSAEKYFDAFNTFANKAKQNVVHWQGAHGITRGLSYAIVPAATDASAQISGKDANQTIEMSDFSLELHATSPRVEGRVIYSGGEISLKLAVAGEHNALNAMAALTVLITLGFSPQDAADALSHFTGTSRRFELKGTPSGVAIYDDYAHHPTELKATLEMAKSLNTSGRVIAVHQPHQFSRTQLRAQEFASILENFADFTVVMDIYAAREEPIPGVTGQLIVDNFTDPRKAKYVSGFADTANYLADFVREGDSVVFLSGGDAYIAAEMLIEKLGSS